MESETVMLFKFVVSYTANSQDKVGLTLQVTTSSVCLYFDPSAQEPTLIMESREGSDRFAKAHMDVSEVCIWKQSYEHGKNAVVNV